MAQILTAKPPEPFKASTGVPPGAGPPDVDGDQGENRKVPGFLLRNLGKVSGIHGSRV